MAEIRFGGSLPAGPLKLRLKELRLARGLRPGELATLAGCHISTIMRLERGEGRPSQADLERFAAALGVKAEDLIDTAARR
jgi:transcriptional regulator with XRE-family HTH domain